ncbi:hypothetical protein [Clostridium ihumii]|uniref:hypothetical protein n=1 Tax=Clostridium ihumii TaxID=1470356 RepID=UPI000B262323|nr:hypothetical protein [Clostridium ihumii]
MNISFKENENNILFVISEYPNEYKSILESQYYSLEHGNFVKKYPKNIDNIDNIKMNFKNYAEEMFLQMGYLKEVQWEKALLSFINKIKGYDIDWWLTGSCALCIRGISVMPHDVDIMLNSKDIGKIKNIFSDFIVEPIISSKGWVVDYFGVLFLNARIDLAFDPQDFVDKPEPSDFGPYARNHIESVLWNGNIVKVPPLELQLQVNRKRKRYDRVKAIEDYLKNK